MANIMDDTLELVSTTHPKIINNKMGILIWV
jgi:hypothetical protein